MDTHHAQLPGDRAVATRHLITIAAILGAAAVTAGTAGATGALSPQGLVAAILCAAMMIVHTTWIEIRWDRRCADLCARVSGLERRRYCDGYIDGVQRRPPAVPVGSLD